MSSRPKECRAALTSDANTSLWQRARSPQLYRYCELLARGYARLPRTPSDALAAAMRAERALPGHAATLVLEGRARFALRDADAAWSVLNRAEHRDPASLDSPFALHDYARAGIATHHYSEALAAFRRLVSLLDLMNDAMLEQQTYLEAAELAMWSDAQALEEGIGYLSEARRSMRVPGMSDVLLASLALALDRLDRSRDARALLGDAQPASLETLPNVAERVQLPAGEWHALNAILLETEQPARARDEWREFLKAAPPAKWAEHARGKLRELGASAKLETRGH